MESTKKIWMLLCALFFVSGNAWSYTQSYLTYWQTSNTGTGNALYQYWVANTGSSTTTQTGQNTFRTETPVIWDYEIPILTQAAFNSIVQATIYQPYMWSYEFIDPSATPGIWSNTTGNSLYDNPYRVLHWYTNDIDQAAAPSGIDPNFPPPISDFDNGCFYGEVCFPEFGYESTFSAILGPDQTSWRIDIQELTRIPGDPDIPYQSNGVSGGGIPLVSPTGPTNVPAPATLPLTVLGLVGLFFAHLRRRK